MDEIDRIKIGRKDEKLVGWDDKPKKRIGTNYPPMRARGAKGNQPPYQSTSSSEGFWIFIFLLFVLGIVVTKLYGLW